ncbi:histone [Candidatus Woesearchaeota archaeon CG10_big_fil_rev_8_21_14_0_10_34_8]|nr:MAG: histone [Candidatus Woesearchaeota archaeon CG10_big_fil_rev_8_21_14_0_10_34_8]
MPKRKTILPKASSARILTKAGAQRVSADAAESLTIHLENIAHGIGIEAVKIARHSGRKTVQKSDIELAVKR